MSHNNDVSRNIDGIEAPVGERDIIEILQETITQYRDGDSLHLERVDCIPEILPPDDCFYVVSFRTLNSSFVVVAPRGGKNWKIVECNRDDCFFYDVDTCAIYVPRVQTARGPHEGLVFFSTVEGPSAVFVGGSAYAHLTPSESGEGMVFKWGGDNVFKTSERFPIAPDVACSAVAATYLCKVLKGEVVATSIDSNSWEVFAKCVHNLKKKLQTTRKLKSAVLESKMFKAGCTRGLSRQSELHWKSKRIAQPTLEILRTGGQAVLWSDRVMALPYFTFTGYRGVYNDVGLSRFDLPQGGETQAYLLEEGCDNFEIKCIGGFACTVVLFGVARSTVYCEPASPYPWQKGTTETIEKNKSIQLQMIDCVYRITIVSGAVVAEIDFNSGDTVSTLSPEDCVRVISEFQCSCTVGPALSPAEPRQPSPDFCWTIFSKFHSLLGDMNGGLVNIQTGDGKDVGPVREVFSGLGYPTKSYPNVITSRAHPADEGQRCWLEGREVPSLIVRDGPATYSHMDAYNLGYRGGSHLHKHDKHAAREGLLTRLCLGQDELQLGERTFVDVPHLLGSVIALGHAIASRFSVRTHGDMLGVIARYYVPVECLGEASSAPAKNVNVSVMGPSFGTFRFSGAVHGEPSEDDYDGYGDADLDYGYYD